MNPGANIQLVTKSVNANAVFSKSLSYGWIYIAGSSLVLYNN